MGGCRSASDFFILTGGDLTRNYLKKNRHLLLALPVIGGAFVYFLSEYLISPERIRFLHTPLDDKIPFLPVFIIPYVLWYLYISLPLIYGAFFDRHCFYRQCAVLLPGLWLCLLFFFLCPTGIDFRPTAEGPGLLRWICRLVYANDHPMAEGAAYLNVSMNAFPSLHVYEALAVYHASFYGGTTLQEKKGLRACAAIYTLLVCISTVFVKQHSVIDIAGGMALFSLVYPVYLILSKRKKEKREQK